MRTLGYLYNLLVGIQTFRGGSSSLEENPYEKITQPAENNGGLFHI